jgi:hypothetical protein
VLSFLFTARSPVLAKMVETDMAEGITGRLVLKDIGAKALEFLLKFIYSGRLESMAGLDCDAVTELINAGTKVKYG